jgi:hypothetical protein
LLGFPGTFRLNATVPPRPRRCSGPRRQTPTPSHRPGSRPRWRRCPALVGTRRDDRAIVRPWLTAAPDPLGRQQPLSAQQPQDSFPADTDAVLATQPGANLAVALTGERRGAETRRISCSKSPSLIKVAGPGRPPPPAWARRAYTLERGAPSTRQTTAIGSWEAMASWAASPAGSGAPFFGRGPQDLVLHLLARRPPGPGPVVPGLLTLVLVVHRHDRHLHPCLLGVQENRERWTSLERTSATSAQGTMW